jgi:hypothetical protein
MLAENEFFGPYGIRSLSRYHAEHPYTFHWNGTDYTVSYLPGESDSGMFGGNSNWRGPVWMPAANANLRVLKNSLRLPWRLLAMGLPLTILLGFGVSTLLFPEFSTVEAALLAVMLAPTDAALGKAVVTNPQVPDNIREDLNVESGLNDGICVPLLFALLAIALEHQFIKYSLYVTLRSIWIEKQGLQHRLIHTYFGAQALRSIIYYAPTVR